MSLEIDEFPGCCAFMIVSGFGGGHPGSNPENCVKEEPLNDYLAKWEKQYYSKRLGLLAALSQPQNERIGKVFLTRKWKLLMNGLVNPRTGQTMYLYFRDLNHTEKRKKRIFG